MHSSVLDQSILETLAAKGPVKFAAICLTIGINPRKHECRAVDRRLQALRKRGLIAFDSKTGWSAK